MILPLLLLLCALARPREYDGSASFFVRESVDEMARSRACLPAFVGSVFDTALHPIKAEEHRLYLAAEGYFKLRTELAAGVPLCRALPCAAHRMLLRHDHRVRQRAAMGVGVVSADGWGEETRESIREAAERSGNLCMNQSYTERALLDKRAVLDCMRRDVGKRAVAKAIVHHMNKY